MKTPSLVVAFLCSASLLFASLPDPDSPLLWYPFDETSGTAAADAAGSNNATATGAIEWVPGVRNGAVRLNLSGGPTAYEYFTSANSVSVANNSSWTAGAWFYLEESPPPGESAIILQQLDGGGTGRSWLTVRNNGQDIVVSTFIGAGFTSGGVVQLETWHHIAMVAHSGTVTMYLDGVEVNRSNRNMGAANAPFRVGNGKNPSEVQQFVGVIDDVAIFDRALSIEEVAEYAGTTFPDYILYRDQFLDGNPTSNLFGGQIYSYNRRENRKAVTEANGQITFAPSTNQNGRTELNLERVFDFPGNTPGKDGLAFILDIGEVTTTAAPGQRVQFGVISANRNRNTANEMWVNREGGLFFDMRFTHLNDGSVLLQGFSANQNKSNNSNGDEVFIEEDFPWDWVEGGQIGIVLTNNTFYFLVNGQQIGPELAYSDAGVNITDEFDNGVWPMMMAQDWGNGRGTITYRELIVVSPDQSLQYEITQQPTNAAPGDTLSPAPTVIVRDQSNNPVSNVSIEVSLSGNNFLPGSTTVVNTDSSGVAVFDNLSIGITGTYTLSFGTPFFPIEESDSFVIESTPSNAESFAVFGNAVANLSTPITINVLDGNQFGISGQAGNLALSVTSGPNQGASFTSIVDNLDGSYTTSYTPQLAGTDTVSITLNGSPISGSPYTVVVELPFPGWTWRGSSGTFLNPSSGLWTGDNAWVADPPSDPTSGTDTILNFLSGTSAYTATKAGLGLTFELNQMNFFRGDGGSAINLDGDIINFAGSNATIFHDGMAGRVNFRGPINASTLTVSAPLSGEDLIFLNADNDAGPGSLIISDELILQGGTIYIRGSQTAINRIRLQANTRMFAGENNTGRGLTTTAPVYFDGPNSIMAYRVNATHQTGGWQSSNGFGLISQAGSGGADHSVNVAAGDTFSFSGTISNNNNTRLIKRGLGTQIITGAWNGPGRDPYQFRVEAGLLHFTSTSTLIDSNQPVDLLGGIWQMDGVANGSGISGGVILGGGSLGGTGTINRPVVLEGGGLITAGSPVATNNPAAGELQINRDISFISNSTNRVEWKWEAPGQFDTIKVGTGSNPADLIFQADAQVILELHALSNDELESSSFPIFEASGSITGFNANNWVIDTGDTGWASAQVAQVGNQIVLQNIASISVSNLARTFDGNPKPVTVTTNQPGLSFSVTYFDDDDNPLPGAPTNAGTYTVVATITDPAFSPSPSVEATLVIDPAPVAITIVEDNPDSNTPAFVYPYEENVSRTVSVTSVPSLPSGDFEILYNGSPTPPENAGTYTVTATVINPNYSGSASVTLRITGTEVEMAFVESSLTQLFDPNRDTSTNPYEPEVVILTSPYENAPFFILYNGQLNSPTAPGNYSVRAFVDDGSLEGNTPLRTFRLVQPTFSSSINFLEGTEPGDVNLGATAPNAFPGSFSILTDTTTLGTGQNTIVVRFTPNDSSLDPIDYNVNVSVAGVLYWTGQQVPEVWNATTVNWNTEPDGSGQNLAWIPQSVAVFQPTENIGIQIGSNIVAREIRNPADRSVAFRSVDNDIPVSLKVLEAMTTIHPDPATTPPRSGQAIRFGSTAGRVLSLDSEGVLVLRGDSGSQSNTLYAFDRFSRYGSRGTIQLDMRGQLDLTQVDWNLGSGENPPNIEFISSNSELGVKSIQTSNVTSVGGLESNGMTSNNLRITRNGETFLNAIVAAGEEHTFLGRVISNSTSAFRYRKRGSGQQALGGNSTTWTHGSTIIEAGTLTVLHPNALGLTNLPVLVGQNIASTSILEIDNGIVLNKDNVFVAPDGVLSGLGTLRNAPFFSSGASVWPGGRNGIGTLTLGESANPLDLKLFDTTTPAFIYDGSTGLVTSGSTALSTSLQAVGGSGGTWLAGGAGGVLIRSTNGVDWSTITSPTSSNITVITYTDDAAYLSAGGSIFRSTNNGDSWTQVFSGIVPLQDLQKFTLADNSSLFIAVGNQGRLLTSTNGTSWSVGSAEVGILTLNSVTHQVVTIFDPEVGSDVDRDLFLAVGAQGLVTRSFDGFLWGQIRLPSSLQLPLIGIGLDTINTADGVRDALVFADLNGQVSLRTEFDFLADPTVNSESSELAGFWSGDEDVGEVVAGFAFKNGRAVVVGTSGGSYQLLDDEEGWQNIFNPVESPLNAVAIDGDQWIGVGAALSGSRDLSLRWRWDGDLGDHDRLRIYGDVEFGSTTLFEVIVQNLSPEGDEQPDPDQSYVVMEIFGNVSGFNPNSWFANTVGTNWGGTIDFALEEITPGSHYQVVIEGVGEEQVRLTSDGTEFNLEVGPAVFEVYFSVAVDGLVTEDPDANTPVPNEYKFDNADLTRIGDSEWSAFTLFLDDLFLFRPIPAGNPPSSAWSFTETRNFTATVEPSSQYEIIGDPSATVTIIGRPAAPSGLAAPTVGSQSVGLTWVDNSAVESGFIVERSLNEEDWINAVVINTANAQSATDSNVNPGTTYFYRVRAKNRPYASFGQAADWLSDASNVISVTTLGDSPLTSFEQWQTDNFGSTVHGSGGPEDDFSGRGIANLLAYALDLNPINPNRADLPKLSVHNDRLRLTFYRNTDADDVIIYVEASEDLADWSEALAVRPLEGGSFWDSAPGVVYTDQTVSGRRVVTINDSQTLGDGPRRFLRVRVHLPEN